MRRRFVELMGVAAVIIAVTVLLKLAPVPVTGQASVGPTAWGEPDLQGIWTIDYETPLQRPPQFADQEFFTDEERANMDRERPPATSREANKTSPAHTTGRSF